MLNPGRLLVTSALAISMAACGSSSDPAPSPSSEATESSMPSAAGPFDAADMAMNEKMDAALGSNVSDTWLAKMIEHHKGAIEMSRIVLTENPSNDVRKMAEDTIAMQGKEVEEYAKMRSGGASDPASAEPYRRAAMAMHQAMMAANGGDASETYLRKMREHHRGAIAMSDVVIAKGTDPKVRAAAEKVRTVQAKEVEMIDAMLAGKR